MSDQGFRRHRRARGFRARKAGLKLAARPGQAAPVDVAIIGAGPVGLFAAFELGLYGLKCHLIDSLDRPGGQCTQLYADKPIYDIPAHPVIDAQLLVDRLMEQIAPFEPQFSFNQTVCRLEKRADGSFRLFTDEGDVLDARAVVIAAGGGAFKPRRPSIAGVHECEGVSLFYSLQRPDDFRGQDVVVAGNSDLAAEAALSLQPLARRLTLVQSPSDSASTDAKLQEIYALRDRRELDVVIGKVDAIKAADGQISAVSIAGPMGGIEVECTRLLAMFGPTLAPAPMADWGVDQQEGLIPVDTEKFETSTKGLFAIGDIAWYPGKLRLILSGFHEAALMARAVRQICDPGSRQTLQYTTSSSDLQKRLGVG